MCGIVGIFNYKNNKRIDKDTLVRMRDSMVHRGPDGAGIWMSPDGQVGLGHRRLSIIDLSETAGQPMCNEDETLWIVYNGEIYNHSEIRPELEAAGHRFKTDHSDTEVIIHAFEQWGINCLERFRGMFAFALWDTKTRELWLVRDRIGVKPLYYSIHHGRIVFASEIKALLIDPGQHRAVNEEALYSYLSFLTTPAPLTMFKGINKLPCSTWLRTDNSGRVYEHRYWDAGDCDNSLKEATEAEIAERLLSELRTSIRLRKVSDVPVGIFLSGGIDSSTNAVLFSEDEINPISTFSIGYEKEYQHFKNELDYARIIAKLVGSNHYEKLISEEEIKEFLPKLVYYQDEPIADSSCIPTYYVSKLSKDNGVTVCQVGEGGDELFCGYPIWETFIRFQKLGNLPFKKMGLSLLRALVGEDKIKYEWFRRIASGEPVFWGSGGGLTEEQKKRVFSERLRKQFKGYSSYEILKPVLKRFNESSLEKTPLNWMSYLDLNMYLPELLLMRADKMSMAVSLEVREPFLDYKFVELAMTVPDTLKIKNGELKYILKKAIHNLLPEVILKRKKQGFSTLFNEWLFEAFKDYTSTKIINFTKRTDFFDDIAIRNLLMSNEYIGQWLALNFILWHEKWIEGKD